MSDCTFCGRGYEGDLCPRCDGAVDVEKVLGLLDDKESRTALPPREIGRFRIVRPLGEGGTGIVYEALDPTLGRPVALKILKPFGLNPELVERFLREARFLARFRHPNVVQIFELGRHEGRDFLTMEYIEGRPFPATTDRREALARLVKVARALGHIHRRSIVHRDLKPSNILVDAAGRPVVMDFGIARSAEAVSTLSLAGSLVGTPAYMAPEQFAGETADARADVYALGVILYEMLAGRRPYQGKTVVELAKQVKEGRAAGIPEISRDLDAVCRRAMAVRPEERYPTADALADDLDRLLQGRPLRRRLPPQLVWALGGALAGLLVVAGIFAFRPSKSAGATGDVVDARPHLEEGKRLALAGRFEEAHAAFDRASSLEEALVAKGNMTLTQQYALHADRLMFPETVKALGARLASTQGPVFDRLAPRWPAAAFYAHVARGEWEAAKAKAPDLRPLKAAVEFFHEGRRYDAVKAFVQQQRESGTDPIQGESDVWLVYQAYQELKPLLSRFPNARGTTQRTSNHAGLLRLEAQVHEARGEREKALATLKRAVAIGPDFLPARLALIKLLQQTGVQKDAELELQATLPLLQAWKLPSSEASSLLR